MIRHVISKAVTAAAVVAVPLALAVPASAAGGWRKTDLTALSKAPAAASAPFGYETFLQGQGAVVRTVYATKAGHIIELSLPPDKKWHAADLTAIAGAPAAASTPFGYESARTGEGLAARVVYRTKAGHIIELFVQPGRQWQAADLTTITQAPIAASAPFGYETDWAGTSGPVERVIYRTPDGHIVELSLPSNGTWHAADLSIIAGAPAAASAPFGYATQLDGQGPVARVVYRTPDSHIVELSVQPGGPWHAADLSILAGAPPAASAPVGYQTHLDGQPPVARVVYRTPSSHIVELSVQPGLVWHAADLTILAGAPAAASAPSAYETTNFNGQPPVARVVYRTSSSHIVELSVQPGLVWHAADLSILAKSAAAVSAPFGFETFHSGPNEARVVYRDKRNHISQLVIP